MQTNRHTLLKVLENNTASFDIRYEKVPYFDNPWHYHPELELTLITKSQGTRFVGDNIERFKEGDLVLLGSNLPHYWRNDSLHYTPNSTEMAEAMILRFRLDFRTGLSRARRAKSRHAQTLRRPLNRIRRPWQRSGTALTPLRPATTFSSRWRRRWPRRTCLDSPSQHDARRSRTAWIETQ